MMTVEEFKAELQARKARQNNRIGTYGEHLYAAVLRNHNHRVESMHREGRDFLIDGRLHVDLKAGLCLGKRSVLGAPKWTGAGRKKGVLYHRALFYDDTILVGSSVEGDPIGVIEVSWNDAVEILKAEGNVGEKHVVAVSTHRQEQKRVLGQLRTRLHDMWSVTAKVVYRDNPIAQKAMGDWGPESFYPSEAQRRSNHLVVLVYFDGPGIDKVFAYPMRCWRSIPWKNKTVGPNPNRRKTFDPAKLDATFKFKNLEHFEATFLSRFLHD